MTHQKPARRPKEAGEIINGAREKWMGWGRPLAFHDVSVARERVRMRLDWGRLRPSRDPSEACKASKRGGGNINTGPGENGGSKAGHLRYIKISVPPGTGGNDSSLGVPVAVPEPSDACKVSKEAGEDV